jgi:hypothetical protein
MIEKVYNWSYSTWLIVSVGLLATLVLIALLTGE